MVACMAVYMVYMCILYFLILRFTYLFKLGNFHAQKSYKTGLGALCYCYTYTCMCIGTRVHVDCQPLHNEGAAPPQD